MPATFDRLVTVRSQDVEAMLAYLRTMEKELARNPLLDRFGRRLDDPHVPLRVPLRVVPYEPSRDLEAIRAREHFRNNGGSGDDADQVARRVWAFRGTSFDADNADCTARATPVRLAEVGPTLDMVVLLGDPGSGKSEWLKHRACLAAETARQQLEGRKVALVDISFPAYLPLRDVAAALNAEDALLELLKKTGCLASPPAVLTDAARAAAAMLKALITHHRLPERLAPWFWEKLTTPPGARTTAPPLVCLDAWDEVRSGQETLARCLNAFAQQTRARLFLTSREYGYTHCPLPVERNSDGPRRELKICPFTWEETETFVTAFFHDDPERGQQILGELRGKIAIAGMAQNPLLTTLRCMAFSPQADRPPLALPARRGEVYERVLDGLLGTWEALDKGESPDRDLIHAKLRLLEEIAAHFFPDEELDAARLHDFLWNEKHGYMTKLDEVHPLKQWLKQRQKRTLDTSLPKALCNDGVLVPGGGADASAYQFLHLTFQEYLTAHHLARQANDEGWEKATVKVRGKGRVVNVKHLVDKMAWLPAWQEVIILLAGQLNDPKPLLTMLSNPKPTRSNPHGDDLFRHRLALAALCLPEVHPDVRQTHATLVDDITTASFSLWWQHWVNQTLDVVTHFTSALPALAQVNGRMQGTPLLTWFHRQLGSGDRLIVAEVLGQLGRAAATPELLASLAELLQDKDPWVRGAADKALQGLGAKIMPEIEEIDDIGGAQTKWRQTEVAWMRQAARFFLSRSRSEVVTPEVGADLANCLRDDDLALRRRAVEAVGGLGPAVATPEILGYLATRLQDSFTLVRYMTAKSVARLGPGAAKPEILMCLTALLEDKDVAVRRAAVEALEALTRAALAPEMLAYLATRLQGEDDPGVRWDLVWLVRELGGRAASPEILTRLTDFLRGKGRFFPLGLHLAAAEALRKIMQDGVRLFRRSRGGWQGRRVTDLAKL